MRTETISHVRPVVRRADEVVVAWIFRLTLAEGGETAFDDVPVDVARKPLAAWTRTELDTLFARAAKEHVRAVELHQRLAVEERADFDLGSLPA
jgi:hypothetical protein